SRYADADADADADGGYDYAVVDAYYADADADGGYAAHRAVHGFLGRL
ncbi:unnamed protein product, partial [Didymodactylos carnosus]